MGKEVRTIGFSIMSLLGAFVFTLFIMYLIVIFGFQYMFNLYIPMEYMSYYFAAAFVMCIVISGGFYYLVVERRAKAGKL